MLNKKYILILLLSIVGIIETIFIFKNFTIIDEAIIWFVTHPLAELITNIVNNPVIVSAASAGIVWIVKVELYRSIKKARKRTKKTTV